MTTGTRTELSEHENDEEEKKMNLQGVTATNWHEIAGVEIFPSVRKYPLWRGESGAQALVLEIAPGAKFTDLDVHAPGPEEVYVVTGVFNDGERDYAAGSFIHNPVDTSHVPQSRDGCTLFVFFPEG